MASKLQAPDRQNPSTQQVKAPIALTAKAPVAGPDLSKPLSPRGARSAQAAAGNDAVSQIVGKAAKTAAPALNGEGPRSNGTNGTNGSNGTNGTNGTNGSNGTNGTSGGAGNGTVAVGGFSMRTPGVGGGPRRGPELGGDGAGSGGAPGDTLAVGNHQMLQADPLAGFDVGKGGQSLPGPVRAQMEGSFGVDFGGVKVHTGAESAQATSAVGAEAMTVGSDIHFGAGKFAPGSTPGDSLLAHELTHVVQQGGGTPGASGAKKRQNKSSLGVSSVGDASEAQANAAGTAVSQGGQAGAIGGAGASVARKAKGGGAGGAVKLAVSGFVQKKPSQRAKGFGALGGEINVGLSADVQATNDAMPEIHARLGVDGGQSAPAPAAEKKPASGKSSAAKGPAEPAGVAPKAPVPTPTQIPSTARPAPVVSVAATATAEQGKAAAKQAFAGITTNASITTTAGSRPKVPTTGDANPSNTETQRRETKQEADTARTAGRQEVLQGRGPEVVQPKIMDQLSEVKKIAEQLIDPPSPVADMDKFAAKTLPADVVASFDQQ